MLWGRAAGRCSFPDCRASLVIDSTSTDEATHIGENCHIVADSIVGPRGRSDLTSEERNSYSNLILLCCNHHRVIDTQVQDFPVSRLEEMKTTHEAWVKNSLSRDDRAKQQDDEVYAGYVDEWETQVNLDEWTNWSGWVLSHDQPQLSKNQDELLFNARTWLLSRIWPGRYLSLEGAFGNFRKVLVDFQETFRIHAEPVGPEGEILLTRKFYKSDRWDPVGYRRLHKQYEQHVGLVENLMVELTRAANYICDEVRNSIQPGYRLEEGRCVIKYGPTNGFEFRRNIPQYTASEIEAGLYSGLDAFKTAYCHRDFYFPMTNEEGDESLSEDDNK